MQKYIEVHAEVFSASQHNLREEWCTHWLEHMGFSIGSSKEIVNWKVYIDLISRQKEIK